jgi:uncharacterized protein YndB with AHSA1/START domain
MSEDIGEITKCYTVTFERTSKHPASRLWEAITNPDDVEAWMGAPAKVDLRPGGDYFVGIGEDGLDGIIVRVENERKLGYVWGWSYIEWEIEDGDDGCRYTFVHHGQTDRGVDADEEGLPAGWHGFFDRLDDHLDGVSRSEDEHTARWHALKPAYRQRLDAVIRGLAGAEQTESGAAS